MNKEQTITKLEEIIYTYENKTESNKLSEFAEGRLSAFRFSLNLIKNINFIHCCNVILETIHLISEIWRFLIVANNCITTTELLLYAKNTCIG